MRPCAAARRRGSSACCGVPNEVADFTDRGRRKMPALMCGADNNYLALTWRQIDIIRKAEPALDLPSPPSAAVVPRPRQAACRAT